MEVNKDDDDMPILGDSLGSDQRNMSLIFCQYLLFALPAPDFRISGFRRHLVLLVPTAYGSDRIKPCHERQI